MRFVKASITIAMMLAVVIVMTSCSSSSKVGELPVSPNISGAELPTSLSTEDTSGRSVLAVYDAVIDPVAKTFTVTPSSRESTYHLPLSQYFQNVLQIVGYGFTPNFWADIKLTHPYPGSGIDGFDPRVIAILPANPGVSFNYPILGVNGNNSVILEPDGYTKLFDYLSGSIPGNTNPFKAYFKDQPYRCWSSTGPTQETQRWQMDITGFGGTVSFKLVVDVSTNYPNPSVPVTDNAPEPVKIKVFVDHGLTPDGGSADITVTLLDWQWQSTIGGVLIEAPDLFNGTVSLSYSAPGPNPNEYVYTGTITNSLLAPEDEYKMIVATWDQEKGIYLYNEFSTPVRLNFYDGDLIWAKRAGGIGYDGGYGITTLSDNSTIVVGNFSGSAIFGSGETNQITLNSAGLWDIFIARYNPDGTLAWAKRAGGLSDEVGLAITTLTDDSIVVTGWFWGTCTFGPDEPNETVLTHDELLDIFIARYNPDGSLVWAKRAGGPNHDYGYSITTLSDNSTVLAGYFYDSATFGPGELNQTILTSAGELDIFIARYNPDGTLAWAKRAGGTNYDYAYGITTLSDDSTVVTGYFYDSAIFGPDELNQTILTSAGELDIFIACYKPDGTLSWVKRAGGTSYDYSYGITTLSDNSTVITGFFSDSATFGPGEPNQTILLSAGDWDIFIARYNPDGTLAWAKRAGGKYWDEGLGITTLSDNSTVVTGDYSDSATFGLCEPNETILAEGYDIFIARFEP